MVPDIETESASGRSFITLPTVMRGGKSLIAPTYLRPTIIHRWAITAIIVSGPHGSGNELPSQPKRAAKARARGRCADQVRAYRVLSFVIPADAFLSSFRRKPESSFLVIITS